MSNLSQMPTDWKKYVDGLLYHYLPKVGQIRSLFNVIEGDTMEATYEYARQTQSYAAATGFTSFSAPAALADGARPQVSSIGTEDGTATAVTYANAFHIDRKLLSSNKPLAKSYIQQHSVESISRIETDVNNTLITNMLSNASQSYSGATTWATTADSVGEVLDAKEAFREASGGTEADFMILHRNEWTDLIQDERMQSYDYSKAGVVETGKVTSNPLGLHIIVDSQMTTGSFLMGKKGAFGSLYVTENFKTFEDDEKSAGKKFEVLFTYVDTYQLPYMLMAGNTI